MTPGAPRDSVGRLARSTSTPPSARSGTQRWALGADLVAVIMDCLDLGSVGCVEFWRVKTAR
jgi:hypothetical protein